MTQRRRATRAFAAGEADIKDVAPDWACTLMDILASDDLAPLEALTRIG